MEPDFWLDRWQRGQIGFHQLSASRYLQQHWQSLDSEPDATVFVPLCGKSLDLLWLREHGNAVVGIELSSIALQAFCMENGIPARRRSTEHCDVYEAPALRLLCGDFFSLTPALLGRVGAVYDRAALISWNAELREMYTRHMTALTLPGVRTLLVTLEYSQPQTAGPPFSVPAAEIQRLYSKSHSIEELSRQDVLASDPRMRARGVTELHEVCYRLTRL